MGDAAQPGLAALGVRLQVAVEFLDRHGDFVEFAVLLVAYGHAGLSVRKVVQCLSDAVYVFGVARTYDPGGNECQKQAHRQGNHEAREAGVDYVLGILVGPGIVGQKVKDVDILPVHRKGHRTDDILVAERLGQAYAQVLDRSYVLHRNGSHPVEVIRRDLHVDARRVADLPGDVPVTLPLLVLRREEGRERLSRTGLAEGEDLASVGAADYEAADPVVVDL